MSYYPGRDLIRALQGHQRRALREHAGAGSVEFDQLAHVVRHGGRHDQPAQPPAGHQKALGKTVGHHQAIIGRREVEETGSASIRGRFVIQPFVHLIGQDPGTGPAAMVQDRLLFGPAERPARRVVGRIDHQQPGRRRHRVDQGLQVQGPGAAGRLEGHPLEPGAHDQRLGRQVRPDRRHHDHLVARIHQPLHRQHQGVDAAGRDGDAVRADLRMQLAGVVGQSFAQLRQAEVVRVEGLALLQRFDRGLADELGRDFVAFAEPEGQHIAAPHAGIRDFADF